MNIAYSFNPYIESYKTHSRRHFYTPCWALQITRAVQIWICYDFVHHWWCAANFRYSRYSGWRLTGDVCRFIPHRGLICCFGNINNVRRIKFIDMYIIWIYSSKSNCHITINWYDLMFIVRIYLALAQWFVVY